MSADMSNTDKTKAQVGETFHVGVADFLKPMIDTQVFIKTPDGERVAARVMGVEGTSVKLKVTHINTRYPLD